MHKNCASCRATSRRESGPSWKRGGPASQASNLPCLCATGTTKYENVARLPTCHCETPQAAWQSGPGVGTDSHVVLPALRLVGRLGMTEESRFSPATLLNS